VETLSDRMLPSGLVEIEPHETTITVGDVRQRVALALAGLQALRGLHANQLREAAALADEITVMELALTGQAPELPAHGPGANGTPREPVCEGDTGNTQKANGDEAGPAGVRVPAMNHLEALDAGPAPGDRGAPAGMEPAPGEPRSGWTEGDLSDWADTFAAREAEEQPAPGAHTIAAIESLPGAVKRATYITLDMALGELADKPGPDWSLVKAGETTSIDWVSLMLARIPTCDAPRGDRTFSWVWSLPDDRFSFRYWSTPPADVVLQGRELAKAVLYRVLRPRVDGPAKPAEPPLLIDRIDDMEDEDDWQSATVQELLRDDPVLAGRVNAVMSDWLDSPTTVGELIEALVDGESFEDVFPGLDVDRLRAVLLAFRRERGWADDVQYPDGIPLAWIERRAVAAAGASGSKDNTKPRAAPKDTAKPKPANVAGRFCVDDAWIKAQSEEDRAVIEACHSFQGAGERWRKLQTNGATDAQLKAALANEWQGGGGRFGPGKLGYTMHGGNNPWIRFEPKGRKQIKLSGKALVFRVRTVLRIDAPQAKKPAQAPVAKSKTTAKPAIPALGTMSEERFAKLRAALDLKHASWAKLQKEGATDGEVDHAISRAFERGAKQCKDMMGKQGEGWSCKGGLNSGIWWTRSGIDSKKAPDLRGPELRHAVRAAADVGEPKQEKPAAKPSPVKTTIGGKAKEGSSKKTLVTLADHAPPGSLNGSLAAALRLDDPMIAEGWKRLQKEGATDATIVAMLKAQWPQDAVFTPPPKGLIGNDGYTIRGGSSIGYWMGARKRLNEPPMLDAKSLPSYIRKLLGIKRPTENAEPAKAIGGKVTIHKSRPKKIKMCVVPQAGWSPSSLKEAVGHLCGTKGNPAAYVVCQKCETLYQGTEIKCPECGEVGFISYRVKLERFSYTARTPKQSDEILADTSHGFAPPGQTPDEARAAELLRRVYDPPKKTPTAKSALPGTGVIPEPIGGWSAVKMSEAAHEILGPGHRSYERDALVVCRTCNGMRRLSDESDCPECDGTEYRGYVSLEFEVMNAGAKVLGGELAMHGKGGPQ
jgi:hypothetical protein